MNLRCFTGEIRTIHSFGLIPSDGNILDACLPNDETVRCDPVLDYDFALSYIEETCLNKRYCEIDIKNFYSPELDDYSPCTSVYT